MNNKSIGLFNRKSVLGFIKLDISSIFNSESIKDNLSRMPKKKTPKEIIYEFRSTHGNKYDYSKVVYINSSTKVEVICLIHGAFKIDPGHHKNGTGCRKCYADSRKITKTEFIERSQVHFGKIYDYSFFEQIPPFGEKIKIKCSLHNKFFFQEPRSHIRGRTGCTICRSIKLSGDRDSRGKIKSQKQLNQDFIERASKVFGNKYNYDEFVYVSSSKKGKIICSSHGEFWQSPGNHLKGTKCPKCAIKIQKEGTFKKECKKLGINYHRALKRRQAGLSKEKIFDKEYIRNSREINKIVVFDKEYPNFEEAVRELKPAASSKTLIRWIEDGMAPEEAFDRIPNPGYANGIIYKVKNKLNNKIYVGLTIQSMERRWIYHQEQAKANHIKGEDSFHAAIREFGADNFDIGQIDHGTTKKDLEKKERYWIAKLNTLVPNGYNISPGGTSGGSNKKPTIVDNIMFSSVKEAATYIAKTRKITIVAAKRRLLKGRIDVKSPSKPGQSHVKTKLYRTWSGIIHGTTNPKSKSYIPGISVYDKWIDFENFQNHFKDQQIEGLVFKRINQEKGFYPNNCKWLSKSEASKISADSMPKKSRFRKGKK